MTMSLSGQTNDNTAEPDPVAVWRSRRLHVLGGDVLSLVRKVDEARSRAKAA
jgi:hypothetical protein